MNIQALCPDSTSFRIVSIAPTNSVITLHIVASRSAVRCPLCGQTSERVHSHYIRSPMDLPWCGWPIRLRLVTRRFFCDNRTCPQRIFTEPFPGILARYSRRMERLEITLLELSYLGSAESAARLAVLLGCAISGDTLIRQQRRQPRPALPPPEIISVDEFSLRRGVTFGTLIVDLLRHRPLEVLEGKEMEALASWLKQYSGIKIVARDRGGPFAAAARTAAPQAVQVADRFHLLRNVGDALKRLLESHRWIMPVDDASSSNEKEAMVSPKVHQPTPRKQAAWEEVRKRKAAGWSDRAIAREFQLNRKTVRKYATMTAPPVYTPRPAGWTKLKPFLPYLQQRWEEGCHNAAHLYREILSMGYKGKFTMLRKVLHPWRGKRSSSIPRSPPSPSRLLLRSGAKLKASEKEHLAKILQANPLLEKGYRLKEEFHKLVCQRDVAALLGWIQEAAASGLVPFRGVAKSLLKDIEAVRNGITLMWSSGQCEGQICRVKLIKRAGYGRAKLDLLRQRILHRLATN